MVTPRTNIQLFRGESFTFEAKKTINSTSNTIWFIDDNKVESNGLLLEHIFDDLGQHKVCIALSDNKNNSSCVGVNILEREVNSNVNIYAQDIVEGDSGKKNLLVEVVLDKALPVQVRYNYETVAKTATKNVDYNHISGELVFEAGEMRKYLNIPIKGDIIGEDDETFLLKVGEVTQTLTIIDDDIVPVLTSVQAHKTVAEGTGANHTVTFDFVLDVAPKTAITIQTSHGVPIPTTGKLSAINSASSVVFGVGQTTASMEVVVVADAIDESDEDVSICLMENPNVQVATNQKCVTLTVTDDDAEPTVWFDPTSITKSEASGKVYGTLKLSHLSTRGASAFVSVSNDTNASSGDYEFTNTNVSFFDTTTFKYVTEKTVELNITDDDEIESLEKVVLEISSTEKCTAIEAGKKFTVNIVDNEVPNPMVTIIKLDSDGNELSNWNVNEADVDKNVTIRLQLDKVVLKSATSLHYELYQESASATPIGATVYPSYHSMIRPFVAGDIEFAIGEQVKDLNITIIGDTINESDKSFKIILSTPNNLSLYDTTDNITSQGELENEKAVSFNIVDNDPLPTVSFEKSTYSTAEGEQVHVKLMLSNKSYQTVEVNLTVNENSTAEDSEDMDVDDYNLSTKHVVILATNPTATVDNLETIVDVNISTGLDGEGDETIILDINSSKNAVINSEANSTTITIVEDALPLSPLASNVFFNYEDADHGNELWRSNGEVNNASLFKDIIVGTDSSDPLNFTRVGDNKLYFLAHDSDYINNILYQTDGSFENITSVHSFGQDEQVGSFVDVDNILYFIVYNETSQTVELWNSNGTTAQRIKTLITVDYMESKPSMVYGGGKLAIIIGSKFLKFDISTTDIEVVKTFPEYTQLENLLNWDGVFYFTVNRSEIWSSSNTTTQKTTILDGVDVFVDTLVHMNNKLYYMATSTSDNTIHNMYRYSNNGTSSNIGTTNRAINTLKVVGNNIYWTMEGSIFASDGTSIITLKEFENGNGIYLLEDSINDELFFTRTVYGTNPAITTLWKTDGTVGGTVNLTP